MCIYFTEKLNIGEKIAITISAVLALAGILIAGGGGICFCVKKVKKPKGTHAMLIILYRYNLFFFAA